MQMRMFATSLVQTTLPELLFSDWNQSSASCAVKPEQSVQDPSNLDTPRSTNYEKEFYFLETKLKKE
ncbi:hypothetical protein evm_011354 [Chilo suppressalis]|nr:hypothetical protein evm_011354 [Chilo suppressalis]